MPNKVDSLFYKNVKSDARIDFFVNMLEEYADIHSKPIYVIDKALGNEENDYGYEDKAIILFPRHKIIILNYGTDEQKFNIFFDDFIDDLEYLSKKFDYQKILGRKRNWEDCVCKVQLTDIHNKEIEDFFLNYKLPVDFERRADLLISLLIGSINDIDLVGADTPETLLDKVKHKIVLFDGMQSRFIYEDLDKFKITIQGLAGTGKTELLLHKLRETYVNMKQSKIVFTCHNKVLAKDMKERIPRFFNFMKVEEQIEWDKRLWVFSSWGSKNEPNTGLYSFICYHYKLEFRRYSFTNTFDQVCKLAVEELRMKGEIIPFFDYVFIDESQDFSDNFFELCKMVTNKNGKIFLAGDIFQDVFDTDFGKSVNSDYLLNKCYRTDPKTLMLAHSIGMGLYEQPVIRWLEDNEWEACGYIVKRTSDKFLLKRMPLRRFEDIDSSGTASIQLRDSDIFSMVDEIFSCIDEIVSQNQTVKPEDIAIVMLNNGKDTYQISDELSYRIKRKYSWESTKGYISKEKERGKVFISNTNNIKGLEFPFIICVETGLINTNIQKRNSIYMILTRSFLSSYFVINNINDEFIKIYKTAIRNIIQDGYMTLREPDENEKKTQAEKIRIAAQEKRKSVEDMINEVCNDYPQLSYEDRKILQSVIPKKVTEMNEDSIKNKTRKMIDAMISEE